MTMNPFVFDSPVRNPQRFFNREHITQGIMDRLRTMQDSSVIGEQRMGKTSLLFHLTNPEVLRRYGLDPARYVFVYVTFHDAAHLTPRLFWQRVLAVIAESIADPELRSTIERARDASDRAIQSEVERLFLRIRRKGLNIVLLLDEFESVTRAVTLDADFFANLRSLASMQVLGLIFVTSSRRKLNELSHAGIVGSPFFNIFETFVLSPFDPAEAEAMLEATLSGTDVYFSTREVEYLTLLSGRHPCLLQMAASYLFDAYRLQQPTDADIVARLDHVEREFTARAERYLRHYWQQSTNAERTFLMALAMLRRGSGPGGGVDMQQLRQVYPDADAVARLLADRGLVTQDNAGYRSLSPALERWVVQEIIQPESAGDYAAWLDANAGTQGGNQEALRVGAADIAPVLNSAYWPLVTEWARRTDDQRAVIRLISTCAEAGVEYPIWREYGHALV